MNHVLNVAEIEIKDLEGEDIVEIIEESAKKNLSQIVGNIVFKMSSTIELSDKAREIHSAKPVILNDAEKTEVEDILKKNLNYVPIVFRSICASMKPTEAETIDELELPLM